MVLQTLSQGMYHVFLSLLLLLVLYALISFMGRVVFIYEIRKSLETHDFDFVFIYQDKLKTLFILFFLNFLFFLCSFHLSNFL